MTEVMLDLNRSLEFDKEEFLNDFIASLHTTPEEFARLYILEEYPIELIMSETGEITVKLTQKFNIRRKTEAEMAEDILCAITQGEI